MGMKIKRSESGALAENGGGVRGENRGKKREKKIK